MVASASTSIADGKFGSSLHFFWRQSAALAVGIACGTVVALIDPRHWQRFATAGLFAGIAALSAVLIPGLGLEANGAVRWLDLGVVTFHPGEAMKIVFVVYLAAYLAQQGEKVRLYGRYALVPISVFCLVAVLLLAEPDFGTVVVLGLTLVGMLFIAGVPFRTFAAWSATLAIAMTVLAVTEPYRLRRLLTFLAPFEAPYGDGFQLVQALIAIGRGEWFGAGLGGSVQKLFYLPAAHTDFLFAVGGEELGLVGMAGGDRPLHGAHLSCLRHRGPGHRMRAAVQRPSRVRARPFARRPGLDQHRGEHRRPAHQGARPAVHELRREQPRGELPGPRPPRAHRS